MKDSNFVTGGKYDVVVCGGGIAGIAAALASARRGKKTLLIERQFILGGLATAGLITVYLPLCDGMGNQVSFGLSEELLRLSILHGAEGEYPENWLDGIGDKDENSKRFKVRYNANMFAILAESALEKESVSILYGSLVTDVISKNNKITHIVVENKSGKVIYETNSVVDATDDCDVAKMAEVPTTTFRQGNILASWYYYLNSERYSLCPLGVCDIPDEDKNENNTIDLLCNKRFSGLDGEEISEFVRLSHKEIYKDFLAKKEKDPNYTITSIPTVPQLRMTRKIVGEKELLSCDEHKHFDDSIGMVSHWRKRGPVYEVPFGTLYNKKVKNLLVAGRCVSSDEAMWDVLRVIPCCAVTGEAAGTAAALTDDVTKLDVCKLQEILRKNGVKLHLEEIF